MNQRYPTFMEGIVYFHQNLPARCTFLQTFLKFELQNASVKCCPQVWVASEQGHVEVIRLLIEARANQDLPAHNDISPLWVASWKGHVEVVQLLLMARANQDKQDRHEAL